MYETRDLVLVLRCKLPQEAMNNVRSAAAIAAQLHVTRFGTYMAAAGGDQGKAIALYRWNLELASALFETLTLTAVVLRNALDAQLKVWNVQQHNRTTGQQHPTEWTVDATRPLRSLAGSACGKAHQAAVTARAARPQTHPRKHVTISHDDVIAQLTFGVFVRLLPTSDLTDRNYRARQVLWTQALCNAFPNSGSRDPDGHRAFGRAERLRSLRNRVAHAEPLLDVNPTHRLRDAGRLLAGIDQTTAGWVMGISRIPHVTRQRPA